MLGERVKPGGRKIKVCTWSSFNIKRVSAALDTNRRESMSFTIYLIYGAAMYVQQSNVFLMVE